MKTIFCIAILSCSLGFNAMSQSFDVSFLPEKKDERGLMLPFKNSFYTFETDAKGMSGFSANLKRFMHENITVYKYNSEVQEVQKAKIKATDKSFGPIEPMLRVFSDKLYLIYFKPAANDQVAMWLAAVDTSTLELSAHKEVLVIDESEKNIQFHLRSVSTYDPDRSIFVSTYDSGPDKVHKSFFTSTSPDATKHAIVWTSGWSKNVFYAVLDKNFDKIRTKKEVTPVDENFYFNNMLLDNAGNVYFVWDYYKSKKYYGELMISKASGTNVENISIDSGEPGGVYAVLDHAKGNLIVGGVYIEDGYNLKGAFVQNFPLAGMKPGTVTKTVFPKDLVELFEKDSWGESKEKKYGLANRISFTPRLLNSGVLNLCGEFRRIERGTKASFVISGSILNIRFDNNKAPVFTRVPKVRVSAGTTLGDTYFATSYKNKTIVFYNDYLSGLQRDINASPKRADNYTKAVLAAAIIGEDGSVKRELVKDYSGEDFLGITDYMQEIANGMYTIKFVKAKKLSGFTDISRRAYIIIR